MQGLKNSLSDVKEDVGLNITQIFHLKEAVEFLAGSFEWWHEELGKTVPKLDELRNATASTNDTVAELEASQRRYNDLIQTSKARTDDLIEALERERKKMEEIKTLKDKLAEAKKTDELGKIDSLEHRGILTPAAAQEARARVERKALEEQRARDKKDRDEQIDLLDKEADALKKQKSQAALDRDNATLAEAAARQREKKAGRITNLKNEEEGLVKQVKEAEEELRRRKNTEGIDGPGGVQSAEEELVAAQHRLARYKRTVDPLELPKGESVATAADRRQRAEAEYARITADAEKQLQDKKDQMEALQLQQVYADKTASVEDVARDRRTLDTVRDKSQGLPQDRAAVAEATAAYNQSFAKQDEFHRVAVSGFGITADALGRYRDRMDQRDDQISALAQAIESIKRERDRASVINQNRYKAGLTP